MTEARVTMIESALQAAFSPSELLVKDQSHLHAGHAGAESGMGHFEVQIVAEAFATKSRIQSHQLIYSALGDLMNTDIHALSIRARSKA